MFADLSAGVLSAKTASQNFSFQLADLSLELGGHDEDKVKLKDIKTGAVLLFEDKQLIQSLAAHGNYAVCQKAEQALAQIKKKPVSGYLYWSKVSLGVIAFIAVGYMALDAGTTSAFMNISPDLESKFGDFCTGKERKRAEKEKKTAAQKRIEHIGKKLESKLEHNPYKFKFYVVENPTLNACAYPGGNVFVNSGLIEKADDNELACVMGHEIGHVIKRHTLRICAHSLGVSAMLALLCGGLNSEDLEKIEALSRLGKNLESLQFSRKQEAEADVIGVDVAAKAGYHPDALINFFKRLQEDKLTADNSLLAILSDHPMNSERIDAIQKEVARLVAEGKYDPHKATEGATEISENSTENSTENAKLTTHKSKHDRKNKHHNK